MKDANAKPSMFEKALALGGLLNSKTIFFELNRQPKNRISRLSECV